MIYISGPVHLKDQCSQPKLCFFFSSHIVPLSVLLTFLILQVLFDVKDGHLMPCAHDGSVLCKEKKGKLRMSSSLHATACRKEKKKDAAVEL